MAYEPLAPPVDAYDDALELHFDQLFGGSRPRHRRRRLRASRAARALAGQGADRVRPRRSRSRSSRSARRRTARKGGPNRAGSKPPRRPRLPAPPAAMAVATPTRWMRSAWRTTAHRRPSGRSRWASGSHAGPGAVLRVIAVVPEVALLPAGPATRERICPASRALRGSAGGGTGDLAGDVDVELVLREGPPAATLAELSRDLDLLLVSCRTCSGVVGRPLRSVSLPPDPVPRPAH